jgi:hypothetical protein
MDDFLLPRAGLRSFDSSASTQSQGNVGYYWSSTPSPTYWAFNLVIANTNVHPKGHHPRAYGFSLRCFKDS